MGNGMNGIGDNIEVINIFIVFEDDFVDIFVEM